MNDLDAHQRQAEEVADRTMQKASTAMNLALEDLERADKQLTQASDILGRSEEAINASTDLHARSKQESVRAEGKLAFWQSELQSARHWLQQAIRRDELAQARVSEAQLNLLRAEDGLRHAENTLEWARCQKEPAGRDRNGNVIYRPIDTAPYQAEVDRAQSKVNACHDLLRIAQEELAAAKQDRRRAEARVAECTQAVTTCQTAHEQACQAVLSSHEALAAAERGYEEAFRGVRLSEEAVARAREEISIAEDMQQLAIQSSNFAYQARTQLIYADQHTEIAVGLVADCIRNINERSNHLRTANQMETYSF
ncbi:hypothetical protein [Endothiovibrio diazotrophicus]